MPSLDSLTAKAAELTGKVDFWNDMVVWGLIATFFAAGFIVFSQRLLVLRAKELTGVEEQIGAFKEAETAERANKAEEKLAGLQTNASDAKASQQRVEIELSKQKEKTANAEKSLLELKEKIQPRRLTKKQADAFVAELSKATPQKVRLACTVGGADEAISFAVQMIPLFEKAGWTVENKERIDQNFGGAIVIGVAIGIPKDADLPEGKFHWTPERKALRDAFKATGIDVDVIVQGDGTSVIVGSKPAPE